MARKTRATDPKDEKSANNIAAKEPVNRKEQRKQLIVSVNDMVGQYQIDAKLVDVDLLVDRFFKWLEDKNPMSYESMTTFFNNTLSDLKRNRLSYLVCEGSGKDKVLVTKNVTNLSEESVIDDFLAHTAISGRAHSFASESPAPGRSGRPVALSLPKHKASVWER